MFVFILAVKKDFNNLKKIPKLDCNLVIRIGKMKLIAFRLPSVVRQEYLTLSATKKSNRGLYLAFFFNLI